MSWERAVMGGNGDDGCSGQSAITQPTTIYISFILLLYNLEINNCPYPAVKTSFPSSISGVYSGDIPNPYKVTCTNSEAASPKTVVYLQKLWYPNISWLIIDFRQNGLG
jgi:hypothetical protein